MLIDPVTGEVVMPFLRTAYNYDADAASVETGLDCTPPDDLKDDGDVYRDRAQQQFRDEVDINTIVERFGLTGQLPDDVRAPVSGDFTDVTDYQSALNAVIAADNAFMDLPAHIRSEFDNNPQKLMDFVSDEKNRGRAEELGLANARPVKAPPLEVRVVPDSAPGPGPAPGGTVST